ncbi:hypothetical protein ABW19_dt0206360 [Dactylella cylindrospora]|nr:hypothetical protein ABW19_dt0206360 [Dactylella cylindrospora]
MNRGNQELKAPDGTPLVQFPFVGKVSRSTLESKIDENKYFDTNARIWDLKAGRETAPPKSAEAFYYTQAMTTESVFDATNDRRTKVAPEHFAPGGKYRSIVKILVNFEKNPDKWMMGTGWLIRPDLMITAGHCAYDKGHNLKFALSMKCYVGYQGKESVGTPSCEFRWGKKIATPAMWISGIERTYDVAFVLLDKPFTGIKPIKFKDTPNEGSANIGVVGYPGDLKSPSGENGAYMYEDYSETTWKLTDSGNMLSYDIDTYGGNSGSPVLIENQNVSIGVHTYGGVPNQATCIGLSGNLFERYLWALTDSSDAAIAMSVAPPSGPATSRLITISKTKHQSLPQSGVADSGDETESFLDGFKSAMNFIAPIASGVGGIIGGPFGAAVGIGCNVAQKLCESSFDGTESTMDFDVGALDGVTERAILQEAALQAVIKHGHIMKEEGVFSMMGDLFKKVSPGIKKALPSIADSLGPIALKIATDALRGQEAAAESTSESVQVQRNLITLPVRITAAESVDPQADEFLAHIIAAGAGNGEEGWISDMVQNTASVAIKIGKPIINGVANIGKKELDLIQSAFPKASPLTNVAKTLLSSLAQATESGEFGDANDNLVNMKGAANRALMGEMALQALMELPRDATARLEEEGIFDTIFDAISSIAPVVSKVAPVVLNTVATVIGNKKAECAYVPAPLSLSVPKRVTKGIVKKPSRGILRPAEFAEFAKDL